MYVLSNFIFLFRRCVCVREVQNEVLRTINQTYSSFALSEMLRARGKAPYPWDQET